MSALSYIGEYGSNSDESDCEVDKNLHQRPKLPAPNLSKITVVAQFEHQDNPKLHGGRKRSFPHVRGNWATFVYIQYSDLDLLLDLLNKLESKVLSKVDSCERCTDFHISLTKTVVLHYHMISSFSSSLQKVLCNIESFYLLFVDVKIFCNEERTRTFISLEVDPFAHKSLWRISKKIDEVLNEFQLPTFYENPSFHMSVLWVNGDKKAELDDIVDSMNEILFQETEKSLKSFLIDDIKCKIGNKFFQYSLS